MYQVMANKKELLETIRKYGTMPINPDRANFLANCWAAYNALCVICGGEEPDLEAHDDHGGEPLTRDQVVSWVASMKNADGSHGGHWTMDQTEQARKQKNIDCDPVMFYAAMNMMYSDYCKVAEKANVNSADFYACMAKAFQDDKDAMPNKLARYYRSVVKR